MGTKVVQEVNIAETYCTAKVGTLGPSGRLRLATVKGRLATSVSSEIGRLSLGGHGLVVRPIEATVSRLEETTASIATTVLAFKAAATGPCRRSRLRSGIADLGAADEVGSVRAAASAGLLTSSATKVDLVG